jgi:NAD-dependent SIR2 family protein deacetylase
LDEAFSLLDECDLLLVIGTSLETYPAAMMPEYTKRRGVKVLIENTDCVAALKRERNH